MAKKIRFPLEMENGIEVRSMEELRDNFSISRVLGYLQDGKLTIWLRDRYANDIAELIEELNLADENLPKKVCEIFDVLYDESTEKELEKAVERKERILRLKQYSEDREYEKVVDNVAFDQDELYDLLDEEANIIYLCGERFSIPLVKQGITYIGINQPTVVIDSKVEVDWDEKQITVENVVFDEKYQSVLDSVFEQTFVLTKEMQERREYGIPLRKGHKSSCLDPDDMQYNTEITDYCNFVDMPEWYQKAMFVKHIVNGSDHNYVEFLQDYFYRKYKGYITPYIELPFDNSKRFDLFNQTALESGHPEYMVDNKGNPLKLRIVKEEKRAEERIYPNDPCPCGSGKKYKYCCGCMK